MIPSWILVGSIPIIFLLIIGIIIWRARKSLKQEPIKKATPKTIYRDAVKGRI